MTFCKPFIKWAGGKAKLAPLLASKLPKQIRTYHEPFVGGGALFCHLASEYRFARAWLGDANMELVNCYRCVATDWQMVLTVAESWPKDAAGYDAVRALDPTDLGHLERAARFLYLNKQCFNGLWRVNSSGKFNVPWGKKARPCGDPNVLDACSRALQRADITVDDFEARTRDARKGDAVYFDPPYPPTSKTANFTAYTSGWKGWSDHERLKTCADRLAERGVVVLVSNADLPVVRELWSGWEIESVLMRRNINSDGAKRAPVGELVIRNRP